jgi:hypothetical protein
MSDETPSGTANVLLEVDGHDDCEEEACMALSGVDDPEAVDVVFVTFTKSADQRLAAWRDHAHAPPANIGIVSVEMGGADGRSEPDRRGGPAVRRISDPSDLTGVGIAISEFLSAWADTDQQTVVCFDSVTALLQYVEANRVFQFLNEMTSKFEQAGAHAHFHLLPAAHEPQDLSVLTSLFGERKTAASVVGAGAAADAVADETVEETASEADEIGFVFNDEEDTEDASTETVDVVDEFTDADDTEDTSADPDADDAETGDDDDADTGDDGETDIDPMEAAFDAVEAAALDDDDESDDGSDQSATADETAGTPQDRVENSVKEVEQSEQPEFGSKRSRSRSKGTTSATTAGTSTAADDGPNTSPSSTRSDDDGASGYKAATYSRTTATVIGVVTMLVLISFLAAAMPLPVANDAPDAGQNAIATATPSPTESSAVSGTQATETPTPVPTDTPTDTPTASPTDTPTATDTPTDTPTPTPTPEPTDTPTPTPTPTPDGSLIDDTTDTVDDTVNDTTDTVDDTVNDTTDTIDDTLSTDDDGLL